MNNNTLPKKKYLNEKNQVYSRPTMYETEHSNNTMNVGMKAGENID